MIHHINNERTEVKHTKEPVKKLISEILEYASSVLQVNPAARLDSQILLDRIDDEYLYLSMPSVKVLQIEQAVCSKFYSVEVA